MARQMRAEFRQAIVTFLIDRDGPRCSGCGDLLFGQAELNHGKVEIDHIIPVIEDGRNRLDNFRLRHKSCNKKLGKRLPNHHRRVIPWALMVPRSLKGGLGPW